MDKELKTPLVSIICLTYNQAQYIRKTLEGFVMQKTNFPIEILIHDDASTDETADIIREYENEYPEIIKPIYQKENQYSKKIAIGVTYIYPKVKGKYIALCEGDDYWTDPLKLQKQVNFLEQHSDYSLIYTRTNIYNQTTGKMENETFGYEYKGYNALLSINCIPTLTICMRTDAMLQYLKDVEPQEKKWLMGDYPAWLWIGYHHKIKYIPDITSVYRVSKESASHSQNPKKQEAFILSEIEIKEYYRNKFGIQPFEDYQKAINSLYFKLFELFFQARYFQKARLYSRRINLNLVSSRERRKVSRFYVRYLVYCLKCVIKSIKERNSQQK